MTTPVTTIWGGGTVFDLANQMAQRGRTVQVYRDTTLVTTTEDPTTGIQTVVPAPQDRDETEQVGQSGITGKTWVVFVGWRGVAGKQDFVVRHGDRIKLDDVWYRVAGVSDTTVNQREATCEALR